MSVVVANEDLGSCRRRLTVEVPAPAVEAETRRVIQDLRKQARLPGFRKGKVPETVIRQRFGDDIRQQVIERLVPRYWHQAQAEAELDPLAPPEVSDVEHEPGEPLRFSARVEVRPPIELQELESFDLPEPPLEPTVAEIDEAIEGLRRRAGDWVAADRPAARGDLLSGELTELGPEDGEDAPQADAVRFEVGDPGVWEELSLAVTGLAPGATAEFERPEAADPAAPPRRFRIQVGKIEERSLPELDDELAAKLGDFDGVEALTRAVEERLREAKSDDYRRQREEALMGQLTQRYPVELPEGVVAREVEVMMRDYAEQIARQGVDPETANVDWGRLRSEVEPRARQRVHGRLLVDAAADKLGVDVSPSELETQLALIARAQNKSVPALRRALDEAGRLDDLRQRMRRAKTMARLLGEPAAAAAGAPGEGAAAEVNPSEDLKEND